MSTDQPDLDAGPPLQSAEKRAASVRRLRLMCAVQDLAFSRVVELLQAQMNPTGCGVVICDEHDYLVREARDFPSGERPLADSIFQFVLHRGEPLMVSDCLGEPRLQACSEVSASPGMRYLIMAPIRSPDGCVVGVVFAYDRKPRFRLRSDLQLFYTLQRQLEDTLLIREHERLDLMTRLLQPRSFVGQYLKNWRLVLKQRLPVAVAMVRVRGLSALNRLPGRYAGDGALVRLADLLRERSPSGATVGRMGGNLFAVLMNASVSRAQIESYCSQVPWAFRNLSRQSHYPREAELGLDIVGVDIAAEQVPELGPMDVLKFGELQLGEISGLISVDAAAIKQRLRGGLASEVQEIERNLSPWPLGGRMI